MMSMYRTLIASIWWMGCIGGPPAGTAVGNPGDADVKVSRTDPGLALAQVDVPVRGLSLVACDGTERIVERELLLDGLSPSEVRLVVPPGTWCELHLDLAEPVYASGTTSAGTPFSVGLALEQLSWFGQVEVDGQLLLFDLPLPLEALVLDSLGTEVELPPEDPLALSWALEAAAGVRLWEDTDDDGLLSLDDRELVPMPFDTAGGPPQALSESSSCGCSQLGPAGGAWLLLVLLGFAQARRRVE